MINRNILFNPSIEKYLAIGLFLCVAFVAFGQPELIHNEGTYLIKGRQVADPSFLAADWAVGEQSPDTHGAAFSVVTAPLWFTGLPPITIALILRIALWGLFAASCLVLVRTLDLPTLPVFLSLAFWAYDGQSMLAGEWLVGGTEQKTLAYASLVMAIASAINRRWIWVAVWLGVSAWFHILIGGWGAVAVFSAMFMTPTLVPRYDTVRSGLLCLLISAPVILLALTELTAGTDISSAALSPVPYDTVPEMMVDFRVPHHLDPAYFIRSTGAALCASFVAAILLSLYSLPLAAELRRFLMWFMASIVAIFAAGLLAYATEQIWFLQFYPFRIADGLLPFFAFVLLSASPWYFYKNNSLREIRSIASIMLLLGIVALLTGSDGIRNPLSVAYAWKQYVFEESPKDAIHDWARSATSPTSTFLIPPWWHEFPLLAERPVVVTYKIIPQNIRAMDWYRRFRMANNYESFGTDTIASNQTSIRNYRRITRNNLRCASEEFQFDFYVVDRERPEFEDLQVFASGDIRIYSASRITRQSAICPKNSSL